MALVDNDLYNEARQSMIVARDDADVGDVFGFESVLEEKSIFSQFHFSFQYNLPVLSSRFTLNMPSGWRAESVTFNTKRIEPTITAGSHVWQMADLKPIRPEPRSPRLSSMVPRIAVSIFPETPTATRLRTFSNWNDVATWMASIEDPQVIMSPQLTAKAKELTENASNEFEKIRAISRYVQNIQYISIQIGTGRGGGYTPRSSAEVFARSYGDCKDKANLMRAMLRAVGIDSYLVSITADDPDYVRAEWASPHQFNHCIIAIKIGDQTLVESVVTHPTLGRLLIFDPTDPYTPIGDLPEDQQGSLALIDHKDTQELTRMPVLSADANRMERVIEATLMPDGSIKGSVTERTTGQPARQERSQMKNLSREDYTRVIDRWISRGAAGATTSNIVTADNHDDGRFDLKVDFSARSYAQLMQDRLMVFRPAIIGRLDRLTFGDGRRMTPYMIHLGAVLLAHRAAQQVRAAQAVAGQILRDLHHLFLIDQDAVGLGDDVVDRGMRGGPGLAMLALAVGRDVGHRARSVKRDGGDQVLEAVWAHHAQAVPHALPFELEDAGRIPAREHRVGGFVVERKLREIERDALRGQQLHRAFQHRQRLEAEEVELHQARAFHMLHRILRDEHLGPRVLVERHDLHQRAAADDDAGGVGGGVAVAAFQLLRDVEQAGDLLVLVAHGLKPRLALDRLRQRDGLGGVERNEGGDAVHLPIGQAHDAADIPHRRLGLKLAEGDDLRDAVGAVFLHHVADHLVAAVLAEIDVEIRHGDAFGVQEAFEEKAEAQRVEIGDQQRPGRDGAGAGAAAGADGDGVALRPLDEVRDDEEVAGEAHALDHAELVGKTFAIDAPRGFGRGLRIQALFEARGRHLRHGLGLGAAGQHLRADRQLGLARLGHHRAAARDGERVVAGVGQPTSPSRRARASCSRRRRRA
ncbi:DUF3857 and transglutaminase domain-containing protein [Leptolyngbya sp. 15MV]|nr:DUF3857 and transglutaminase domain-containing protein [Leptolyngbya sp. 15MV]